VPEVGQVMKAVDKTDYAMAQNGVPPALNVRGQRRLKRADLDQWVGAQKAARDARKDRE
jgi:excisionase family DNA binding protein